MFKKYSALTFYFCFTFLSLHAADDGLKAYRLSVACVKDSEVQYLVAIEGMENQVAGYDPLLFEIKEAFQKMFGDAAGKFASVVAAEKDTLNDVKVYILDNAVEKLFLEGLNTLQSAVGFESFLTRLQVVGFPSLCARMSKKFPWIKCEEYCVVEPDDADTWSTDSEPDENNFMCSSAFKKWMAYLEGTDLKKHHRVKKFMDDYAIGRCMDVKKLNPYLYEYKQFDHNNGLRVYLCETGDVVHLLDGGNKKEQQSDIDYATKRAKDLLADYAARNDKKK
jgi:putative addiction module killer protein